MEDKEIGLKVALKDRRDAIAGLKDVQDEVDKTGRVTDDAGKTAEKSSGRWKRLGGALGTAAKATAVAGAAIVGGALVAGKALYGVGAQFDDMSDTIRVGTGATGKNLDALVGSAKAVGKDIPVAFDQIGPAVADINTRLGLTGPVLEKLSKQTLMAGEMMGEAIDVNAMSGAFSAFQIEGKRTTGAMDAIYQISQATGVGMNELFASVTKNGPALRGFGFGFKESAAWIGTLDKAGLDGNKTIASLSKAMVQFSKDGLEPKKALRDTIGEIEGFTKAGNQAGAINAAAKIFGTKGAGQFVAAVQSGKVELGNLMGATGATSDTILKAGKDTADFTEKWQIFKNRALLAVEPVATRVFDAIGNGMDKINADVVPMVQKFIGEMKSGEGAGGKFADALDRAKDIATDVGTAIKNTAGFLVKYKGVVAGVTGAVVALVAITKIHNAVMAVQAAGGLVTMIKGLPIVAALTRTWAAVQWVLNAALNANPIGLIVLGIAALVAGFVLAYQKSETFRNIVNAAFGAVKGVVMGVVNWIKTNWPLLLAVLTGPIGLAVLAITKNWDKIKAGAGAVKGFVVEKFNALIGFFTSMPGKISTAASGMWDGIKDTFKGTINFLIDAWNSIDFGINISVPDWVPKIGGKGFKIDDVVPDIPRLAKGGIVPAQPGGILANIGEGRWDEAVVPMDGREYLINGTGVTPLPAPQAHSDRDLDAMAADDGAAFAAAFGGVKTVQLVVDRKVLGEVVLDDVDDRMARR